MIKALKAISSAISDVATEGGAAVTTLASAGHDLAKLAKAETASLLREAEAAAAAVPLPVPVKDS